MGCKSLTYKSCQQAAYKSTFIPITWVLSCYLLTFHPNFIWIMYPFEMTPPSWASWVSWRPCNQNLIDSHKQLILRPRQLSTWSPLEVGYCWPLLHIYIRIRMWSFFCQVTNYPLVNIQTTMENHFFWWVNQLFLWQFSIATCKRLPVGKSLILNQWFHYNLVGGFNHLEK